MFKKYIFIILIGITVFISLISEASFFQSAEKHTKAATNNFNEGSFVASSTKAENIRIPNLCPQHYTFGAPVVVSNEAKKIARRSFYLCEENYAVQFDPATKTPLWVAERLIGSQQIDRYIKRVDNFQPHPIVPKSAQASLADYRGSKFDRGHMAPAANMQDDFAMGQSFFLTNIVPQVGPNMNRGIWADLEAIVRKWSITRGEILVVTGPIFGPGAQTIGKSNVMVPTHLYKVVFDPKKLESIAFIMPNVQIITNKTKNLDQGNPAYPQTTPDKAINCRRVCTINDFIVSLSDVEKYTGILFFPKLNPQQKQQISQQIKMWPIKN